MQTALFIHGFNSDSGSDTGKYVKELKPDYDFIIPTFNLLDINGTLRKIREIVSNNDVSLIVGHSLGGFYTLATDIDVKKIVINPCMKPSIEIPKLDASTKIYSDAWSYLEKQIYSNISDFNRDNTFGLFGLGDSLFSYYGLFCQLYNNHGILKYGTHKFTKEQLLSYLPDLEIMSVSNSTNLFESILRESYKNIVLTRMNARDKLYISKYKDEIWKILSDGYKDIGGIAGCKNVEKLFADASFIKLMTRNDKVTAVVVYDFKKGGRKITSLSCLPTPEGKNDMQQIVKDDLRIGERGMWIEVSGKMERMMHKLGATPIPVDILRACLPGKDVYDVDDEEPRSEGPVDIEEDDGSIKTVPGFVDEEAEARAKGIEIGPHDYHYIRQIGKQYHTKIAYGKAPIEK